MNLEYPIKRHSIPIILLVLICAAVFSSTFKNPFMWDDEEVILKNEHIKDLKTIPFLFTLRYWKDFHLAQNKAFIQARRVEYRPVTMVSFGLDYLVWKVWPLGYHLTNLLLHILNVILIYFLIYGLGMVDNKRRYLAFLAALFFAVHPIHTESVAWIKNRSDLLASLFFLLSFFTFILYRSQHKIKPQLAYTLSLVSFIIALSSKEIAVTLPIVLAFYIACFVPREKYKKAVSSVLPFFAVMIFYIIFQLIILSPADSRVYVPAGIGLYPNIIAVIKTLGYYTKLLILPMHLNAERLFNIPQSFLEPGVFVSLVLLLALAILVIKTFRHSKAFSFAILWIFVTILPASNIIFISTRPIAEQRLYIPSIGFCVILAILIQRLKIRNLAIALTVLIVSFYSYITFNRNLDWVDSVTFWTNTVEGSPYSSRAHNNLGTAYEKRGMHDKAIEEYKEAGRIDSDIALVYNNLGVTYREIGKNQRAIGMFRRAIELSPAYAEAYTNLGVVLYKDSGEVDSSTQYLQKAIELRPDYAEAYYNLGVILYENLGQLDEAIRLCKKAVELKPDYADAYYNLGLMHNAKGLYEDAAGYYQKAIELNSNYADAYNNLGALLYNYKKEERLDEAIRLCKKAVELKPDYADAYYNLGLMHNAKGLHEDAVAYCQKAIGLKPGHIDAYNNLGVAYRFLGRHGDAIKYFKIALERNRDHLGANMNIALTYYYDEKRFDLAKTYLQKVLEIDPDNITAKDKLEDIKKKGY